MQSDQSAGPKCIQPLFVHTEIELKESEANLDLKEKMLTSEYVFCGKILQVRLDSVQLPDGRTASREVVEYSGAVAIVALDSERRVALVRQYRYAVGEELLEIPAGKLEENEEPLACAKRELAEETGFSATNWRLLCSFYTSPGAANEIMHLFLATGLVPIKANKDSDEFLEIELVPLEQALEMIAGGQIKDGKSLAGLLSLALNIDRQKR